MSQSKLASVLFVCLGNICRSPTAEAVFRKKSLDAGIRVRIDSAGTLGYHEGSPADPRSRQAGQARGYDFGTIVSRPIMSSDFAQFDYILAMDECNLKDLHDRCPPEYTHKVALLLNYAKWTSGDSVVTEVPDPYYKGEQGFELVLDLVENACDGLLQEILSQKSDRAQDC